MQSIPLSRRQVLTLAGLGVAQFSSARIPLLSSCSALAETAPVAPSARTLAPLNRFPEMLQSWLVNAVREAENNGETVRSGLSTKAEAEAYVKSVQTRIRNAFGPLPERTPLNPSVTKVTQRDGYRIENIVFESRPKHLVTGNLYVPDNTKSKCPGVLGLCGHSANGKAMVDYQAFAQNLARLGYVCFIIDPVGQGERIQFLDPQSKSKYGAGVQEHLQMGNAQSLVGEFLGTWLAWDGSRALDYLLTREEVDPAHLGVTGNSGGGTQTAWLCALEPRFTMAAPASFITTLRRTAETELPQDIEQCPPHILAEGLDHSDFLAAMAPKPVIILAQEKDFFDVRGARETYERLKRLYALLGAPENIQLHIGPDPHGYFRENREGMYLFFNKITGVSSIQTEPSLTIESDDTLQCTEKGQVAHLKSRTVFALTREIAYEQASRRGSPRGEVLVQKARTLLKIPPLDSTPPDYRILRGAGARAYPSKTYCTYALQSEPGIQVLVTRLNEDSLTSRLPSDKRRAVLYVSHRSSDAELREEPFIRELLASSPDTAFYACDVRGVGDSQPDTCGSDQFLKPYGSHYFYAAYGVMLDRPLIGARTFDVLRTLQLLRAAGHSEIHLTGKGWGALPAAFAALLNPEIQQVTLKNALASYTSLLNIEDYRWPYAAMLPGVVSQFDLPDCYAELRTRGLTLIEPWGPTDGMN